MGSAIELASPSSILLSTLQNIQSIHCAFHNLQTKSMLPAVHATFALCLPILGFALVSHEWKFDNAPTDGLNDVTFAFNMAYAPHKSGFFFAQQFDFYGLQHGGYTGLQPRPDSEGKRHVHAAFSSFENCTTTNHKSRTYGADGGVGVSCKIDIDGDYGHTYNLVVENTKGTTWRATLVDTATGSSISAGEWTLPKEAGKLTDGSVGFLEYWPWNGDQHTCHSLPFTEVTIYNPTSETVGVSGGQITNEQEYGDCVNKVGYSAKQLPRAYDIKVGFPENACRERR